ncbi:hypothetical protein H4R34_000500 [Dimargaris verticillata]|uniref:DUF938 domain-containing protein n=1 Tax=Dimargaris verticillata TaxID=2761393 RepID=A0A9W8B6I6_9FUNG|nr:hypothetical protein H4R34_000500 [Dimargaris verticillata]
MEFYPATARNCQPILDRMRPLLSSARQVLEVSSGTGQHVAHFASECPNVTFQPTEYNRTLFKSIQAYTARHQLTNVAPPLPLDTTREADWQALPGRPYDLVITTNLTHISPWATTLGLVRGAASVLKPQGHLCIYGPFKRHGEFTTDSNQQFDHDLRNRDALWGLRNIEAVTKAAAEHGLQLTDIVDMPANNFFLQLQYQGLAIPPTSE